MRRQWSLRVTRKLLPKGDAALIRAVREFHHLRAVDATLGACIQHTDDAETNTILWAYGDEEIWPARAASVSRVASFKAKTLRGLRAKASVAEVLLLEKHGECTPGGRDGDELALALSLVRDARRPGLR
jgi:hypothetical protein